MKKARILFFYTILLLLTKEVRAQWTYVNSIESSLNTNFNNYEVWLKNNGYQQTKKFDAISDRKAATMSAIYNLTISSKVYQSKTQPTRIHCYSDSKQILKSIDVFLINPKAAEFENIELVLLKSGFQLLNESKNESDKTSRTYFQKKKIRLNLSLPNDRSYLTISATTLSNYE